MENSIESVTRLLLSRALDAAVLRQQVFAANLANAALPGHAALAVSFESSLGRARDDWMASGRVEAISVEDAAATVEEAADADGAPRAVHHDEQVTQMAANAVHHQALLQGVSRQLSLLALAVSEGRR